MIGFFGVKVGSIIRKGAQFVIYTIVYFWSTAFTPELQSAIQQIKMQNFLGFHSRVFIQEQDKLICWMQHS